MRFRHRGSFDQFGLLNRNRLQLLVDRVLLIHLFHWLFLAHFRLCCLFRCFHFNCFFLLLWFFLWNFNYFCFRLFDCYIYHFRLRFNLRLQQFLCFDELNFFNRLRLFDYNLRLCFNCNMLF